MTLQIISKKRELLEEIAHFLLNEHLIANAMISERLLYLEKNKNTVDTTKRFILKSITKSLLFSTINEKLRERYQEKTPFIYSEPIILIDPIQTEDIISRLVKV